MKLIHLLSVATALLVLAPPAAFAGKGQAKGGGDPTKKTARKAAHIAARYDRNSDGAITGEESAALREAFKADPLRAFDLNADGTLDDTEIAGIKPGKHGKGAKAGKGAQKKKSAV